MANFLFPLRTLENDLLKLVPFDVSLHGPGFLNGVKDHPSICQYMPSDFTTPDTLAAFISSVDHDLTRAVFAITAGESVAGMIGYLNATKNYTIEIGFIVVLPDFQGTFVARNAIGLLLQYALDAPPNGLGLKRCQWQAHALNTASQAVARKMLFTYEGTLRFERAMPTDKPGNGYDHPYDILGLGQCPSRDTTMFAHYCDEWKQKGPLVQAIMESSSTIDLAALVEAARAAVGSSAGASAALTKDGHILIGVDVANVSAELVVLGSAAAKGYYCGSLTHIVTVDTFGKVQVPSEHCRQTLLDLQPKIRVVQDVEEGLRAVVIADVLL